MILGTTGLERGCFAKLWRNDGQVLRLTASELAVHRGLHARRQARAVADPGLRGKPGDLQLTLKMLEVLQAKQRGAEEAIRRAEAEQQKLASEREHKRAEDARTQSGPTPQPLLPVLERELVLEDGDRACPSCGGELRPITGQFEESELIDVIEVRYEFVKVKQQKYVCRCGGCVETALGPERATPGSRYSLAFAIKVVLDKWLDHIPLKRQCRILERHGLVVTSQTLWDLANVLARRLTCVDAALQAHVLKRPVIGLDQTSWPRLEGADAKPWQMWCLTAATYLRVVLRSMSAFMAAWPIRPCWSSPP